MKQNPRPLAEAKAEWSTKLSESFLTIKIELEIKDTYFQPYSKLF